MAIDYGTRRIGVAVSDSGVLASPHSVVPNEGDVIERLARLASELGADTIVVGIPRRQPIAARAGIHRLDRDRRGSGALDLRA